LEAAASREEGKALLDLLLHLLAATTEQGAVAEVVAEAAVGLADEIEHRAAALGRVQAQTQPALAPDRRGVCR